MKDKESQSPFNNCSKTLDQFNQFSIPSKRHDAPVSMKLPANSPYYPAEKQMKTHLRKQSALPAEDGSTTDLRTNIHRYKTHKEANIHLEIINGYQKTIEQYYTATNKNKLNANQQNCS